MLTRKLGLSGIAIPRLILGGNVFGWTADRDRSFRVLDTALEAGLNTIDTADVYARWVPGNTGGESESILGEWMRARGNRSKVIIATKVGAAAIEGYKGLSREGIQRGIQNSLRRLQTDYVDLYQSHRDDETVPLEETMQAFGQLVSSGQVRAIGASNYSGVRLQQALATSTSLAVPTFQTIQPQYNLMERGEYERDLAPIVARERLTVIPYYALASGFLTGKYRSAADLATSSREEAVGPYLGTRGSRVLLALDSVAERLRATPTQIALAWLMSRPGNVSPIASASKPEQIGDLAAACSLELETGDREALDAASR